MLFTSHIFIFVFLPISVISTHIASVFFGKTAGKVALIGFSLFFYASNSYSQLQSEFLSNRVEMKGTFGDIYFFLNDVFHGRAVNSTGRKLMMSRFGGFSSAFEFKNDICIPSFPLKFPEVISELYRPKPKFEVDDSFLLGEISLGRKGGDLQHLARLEKMILINEERINNLSKQIADSGIVGIKTTDESYLHSLKKKIRRVANPMF